MSSFSLTGLLIEACVSVLGFLASPFGGRDLGNGILMDIGLRRGSKRRK